MDTYYTFDCDCGIQDMMDIFMTHISRLSDDNEKVTLVKDSGDSDLEQLIQTVQCDRDREDLNALKRSYHAMEILCGTSAHHFIIQDSRFKVIGKQDLITLYTH